MIPIADHEWHDMKMSSLPKGHRAEVAEIDGGGFVVRIVGPNAHVLGEGDRLKQALDAAVEWFNSVGGEL